MTVINNLKPEISVVMPVYNGSTYLEESINSILSQTFTNFEFIIIDDGSTDETPQILKKFLQKDSRIRVITNEKNIQIAASLNKGIQSAISPLIARMDADDWSYPERLEKQYAFMQAHTEVTVCGAWLTVYETGTLWEWPVHHAEIMSHLLFNSPIAHPTAVFRKDAILNLTGGYTESMPPVEDYDLWVRLSKFKSITFANLPEILLRYRIYSAKMCSTYHSRQLNKAQAIRIRQICQLGLNPTPEEVNCHLMLAGGKEPQTTTDVIKCVCWLKKICKANDTFSIYQHDIFIMILDKHLNELCYSFARKSPHACWIYLCHTVITKNCGTLKKFAKLLSHFIVCNFRNITTK